MAEFKAKRPVIAPITGEADGAAPTYGTGMSVGKLISVSLTVNTNEGSLYADDGLAEYLNEFKDIDVSLNISTIPAAAYEMIFGATVDEDGVIHSTTADQAPYMGFGFVKGEIVNNVQKYWMVWIPKVKFAPIGENCETKGDSISWKTPTLTGKGTAGNDGEWRTLTPFDTEAEAVSALYEKAGIVTAVAQQQTDGKEGETGT